VLTKDKVTHCIYYSQLNLTVNGTGLKYRQPLKTADFVEDLVNKSKQVCRPDHS